MAEADDLEQGDTVEWRTPQGKTRGTVVEKRTSDFSIKGTDLKASKDDPKVVVESEKSGRRAGHKPESVTKVRSSSEG